MEYLNRCVRVSFPELHEKIYFVPAVHFNRVQYEIINTESVNIKVQTPSPQLSDVREDEAHQRVLHSLKRLFELLGEVMVVISSLDFDTYLNNLSALTNTANNTDPGQSPRGAKAPKLSTTDVKPLGYSAIGIVNSTGYSMHKGVKQRHKVLLQNEHKNRHKVHFVRPRDLSTDLNRGTFDVLMITKNYGMVVIEIKAIGDAFGLNLQGTGSVNEGESIRTKIQKAVTQLVKETKVLRHLTEDLDPKLSIMRSLILPNLKRKTLEEALSQDQELTEAVCECMEEANLSDALSRCLFTDHLPPIGRPWDIQDHVTKVLPDWWNLLVGRQRGQPMSDHVYESLVARFCGPATPLRVNTAYRQKAEVSTLPDAVLETALCYREWTLTPDQVNILRKDSDPRVYLTGPPGTGKTIMLVLRALRWLRRGHDVYFISLWTGSEAASRLLCRLVKLTQCLHCPPVVTREIEKGSAYRTRATYHYATGDSAVLSSLPPPTDGPSVMRVSHDSHRTEKVWDCIECGTAVAEKLKELKVGVEDGIKYSDVLISGYDFPSEVTEKQTYANDAASCEDTDGRRNNSVKDSGSHKDTVTPKILRVRDRPASKSDSTEHQQLHGFLKGIVSQDFPVGVLRRSDLKCNFAEELSSRTVNQIQVAEPQCILGLKWTVVVAIGANDVSATYPRYVDPWCDVIARCLSQLIVVGDLDGSLEKTMAGTHLKD